MDWIDDFSGTVPLFPLPNVALFPHVVQALHMFEPRYRQMTADAVAGDGFVALAVLKPGYDDHYNRKDAPIYPTVCLGRITNSRELADGRWDVTVQGLCRATVERELPGDDLYRVGELSLRPDSLDTDSDEARRVVGGVVEAFGRLYPKMADHPLVAKMLRSELPCSVLCDFIAHAAEIETETAARILCEADVCSRGRILTGWLNARLATQPGRRPFPPEFSAN